MSGSRNNEQTSSYRRVVDRSKPPNPNHEAILERLHAEGSLRPSDLTDYDRAVLTVLVARGQAVYSQEQSVYLPALFG